MHSHGRSGHSAGQHAGHRAGHGAGQPADRDDGDHAGQRAAHGAEHGAEHGAGQHADRDDGDHAGQRAAHGAGHGAGQPADRDDGDHAGQHAAHGAGHGAGAARHDTHAGHDPERFRRTFWLSLALTVPIVVTSEMVMEWFGYRLDFPGLAWVGPVLGSVVFFVGGAPFLAGGLGEIRDRAPGMMLLISMAITVAYVASMATTVGVFDLDFWWELAALVTVMLLGHWQEMKAIGQARGALAALAALLPDEAERVRDDGSTGAVPVAELRVGDTVLVRSGARVPADGRIIDGAAELDESMITGESRPVPRGVGDRVVAGTVATDSALRVRVDAIGEDTALAGIGRLVAQAQQSSGRAQALADRFAAMLFFIATAVALVAFVAWWGLGDIDGAVVRTVTVLVIACPHALGLAIPLVIALSTAVAAKAGILVKDRLALERMRTIDTVVFDKTGTLTKGAHAVTAIAPATGHDEAEVLRLAAAVESDSEHPLARAIVAAAPRQGVAAVDFRSLTGRGVRATVDGTVYAVGGPALLRELAVIVPAGLAERAREWSSRGASVLHLVRLGDTRPPDESPPGDPSGPHTANGPHTSNGPHDASAPGEPDGPGDPSGPHTANVPHTSNGPEVLGALALEDEVRPEARQAIEQLRAEGVRTIMMITGDARPVAEAVAADLGFRPSVDEVHAEILPADKDAIVAELRARGLRVAMVGDGVNDAPALARADVGVAIGAGTDVAIESAGVVLASSDPRGVVGVIRLSNASYRKMVQNLGWAAGYNVVALPVAAGALAWAGVTLSPAVGAILMSASTIVVALNAQLLRRVRLTPTSD